MVNVEPILVTNAEVLQKDTLIVLGAHNCVGSEHIGCHSWFASRKKSASGTLRRSCRKTRPHTR